MIDCILDGAKYSMPESWSDVDPERLPQLLHLVYFSPENGETYHELIRIALNIRPSQWKAMMQKHFGPAVGKKRRQANAVVLHNLLHGLRWTASEPIQKRPFEAVVLPDKTRLLLPEENFLTLSYGELIDCYIHFLVFIRQLVKGDEHLNLLVATLCRPERRGNYRTDPSWDGDPREAYNEFSAKDRAKKIAAIDPAIKMAVLLYFAGNLRTFLDRYDISADGTTSTADEYPGQGFTKNLHWLAEKGIFGTITQTKATNCHDVFIYLEEHKKDLLAEIERNKE